MNFSIHSRILFSALIILVLFMGLTGIVLDKAFRTNINDLQRENLRTQIYSLLAAAEIDENGQLPLHYVLKDNNHLVQSNYWSGPTQLLYM